MVEPAMPDVFYCSYVDSCFLAKQVFSIPEPLKDGVEKGFFVALGNMSPYVLTP